MMCTALAADTSPAPEPQRADTYTNPIIHKIGPADPHVIQHDGTYYLYPTDDGLGYDVYTSTDLVHWECHGKCYEDARHGVWAPDVFLNTRGDGRFYLYYTVGPLHHKQVGVAVSESPLGPFEDKGVLVDKAIDAHLFQDTDDSLYLYYVSVDGPNRIYVQPMADLLTTRGEPKLVIRAEEPWECAHGEVAEGPFMILREGTYYLMYSGSGADGPDYAIGYATAQSPIGPFTKYPGNPIAKRGAGVLGPGHHSVVEGPKGDLWMVYHQKLNDRINFERFLAIDPLWFDKDGVMHARTTRGTAQPAP
ncbi:MAG: glycoside hydrolase family 43 protein [Candidatus Hydrogenedentes bacterium]|nr:glycoside hydrolase family 43 protein [Candidatus Hydrogenedentota bacterium]